MAELTVVDDRGSKLFFRDPPARIVSLVPSDTYSLVRLGARARIVGRTRYCVAPAGEVDGIAVVGGPKDVDVDAVASLAPDLVVANQEENAKESVERLQQMGLAVLVSFPLRMAAGVAHLARLARVLGFERGEEPARSLIAGAYHALQEAEAARAGRPMVRTFVPVWMHPLMTVGGATFVSDALAMAGARNVFDEAERRFPPALAGRDARYPQIALEEVTARDPELVLLPDEPHAFTEADAAVFRGLPIAAARRDRVRFCDGKDILWYGARAVEGLPRMRSLVSSE